MCFGITHSDIPDIKFHDKIVLQNYVKTTYLWLQTFKKYCQSINILI